MSDSLLLSCYECTSLMMDCLAPAGSQTDMSDSLRAGSTPGGGTPEAGATPEAGGPVTPQNAHLRSASMSSAGSGGAYGDTSGGKIAEYAQLTQVSSSTTVLDLLCLLHILPAWRSSCDNSKTADCC